MTQKSTEEVNYYALLDLTLEATSNDIRRAYKKKALKCHPDKNPDNPKAAELFHQLTKALELLLNNSARLAYDKLLKAKEAAKLRHKALDDRRKRFKEDLEARERAASSCTETVSEVERCRREVERLQKEGADLLLDELNRLQKEVKREMESTGKEDRDTSLCQLKVTWEGTGDGHSEYSQDVLRRIFSKYGDILAVVTTGKKAIVEFQDSKAADLAIKIEVGFVKNPLKVTYASSKLRKAKKRQPHNLSETLDERAARQAEERRRLTEELLKSEGN